MSETANQERPKLDTDVLIIGAGISGISAAWHVQHHCPQLSYRILEAREASGGTWDLFHYPGVRSDSDMFTLGYAFSPWLGGTSLADGPAILNYLRDTAKRYKIDEHIYFQRRAVAANWHSQNKCWEVEIDNKESGGRERLRCRFLLMCSGYYNYEHGYQPHFPGQENFQGQVIHPQQWPQDLDYREQKVIIIGSGATAVTLAPAMAPQASHVTVLQRSPTYILSMPNRDGFGEMLNKLLPARGAWTITRWKNIVVSLLLYKIARWFPNFTRRLLLRGVRKEVGDHCDVDLHFAPRYKVWDERLCVVPDGDLFAAIRSGKVSMATDEIEGFDEKGINLRSGQHLDADIVVTATGLDLQLFGGLNLSMDGQAVDVAKHMVYRGMMLSDIPNLAFCTGYTNASWTLKVDLSCGYIGRVLKEMCHSASDVVVAAADEKMEKEVLLDLQSGYIARAAHLLPQQGKRSPWKLHQNYLIDTLILKYGRLKDGVLRFE